MKFVVTLSYIQFNDDITIRIFFSYIYFCILQILNFVFPYKNFLHLQHDKFTGFSPKKEQRSPSKTPSRAQSAMTRSQRGSYDESGPDGRSKSRLGMK